MLALALSPPAAGAQAVVEVPGVLSDEDFYRAAACAAPPGGACRKPVLRWDASRPVRVALRRIDPGFLGRRAKVAGGALTLGLRRLNGLDADFRLARVPDGEIAEIEVFFLDIRAGDPIAGTGIAGVDGTPLGGTTASLLFEDGTGRITRAVIVVAGSLATAAFQPALLAELTRAMGLTTGIAGPAYHGVSVLAAEGGAAKALGLQDIMALKRHYGKD
ncbi:hypothetical protein [Sinisalibacter aestuarii]|uniref:hypothetical protein n=1 Tax=Sinisalibacter aestuarii TaxID=2949426 RepID=UPI0024939451|nr:hypothetical protein [Sinisalibacter aestuarii]